MSVPTDHPLHPVLAQKGRPLLVLHDAATAGLVADLAGDDVVLCRVGATVPGAPRRWPAVALVVPDALALRRAVSVLPPPGRTRLLTWWLVEADRPALVLPRPEWPATVALDGRSLAGGGAVTTLRTERPVAVQAVLGQVARDLTPTPTGQRGLVVATTGTDPAHAPPADPGLVVADTVAGSSDPARPVPPDVVLTDHPTPPPPTHDVLGRPPVVVTHDDLLVGPLDEGLLNPAGFLRHAGRGPGALAPGPDATLRIRGAGLDRVLPRGEVTPSVVAALRPHAGVRVDGGRTAPATLARAVASLAMAGVPLVGDAPPPATGARLGPGLLAALGGGVDLARPRSREEHSVRLRRAALLEHSTLAWRAALANRAGTTFRRFPTCTVLLCSDHPARWDHVLGRIDDQRGVDDLEVVVVTRVAPEGPEPHGAHPLTVVTAPASSSTAEALDLGLEAAAGDVVVLLDDTSPYDADVVADLLLARHYSGAALVEMPAEPRRTVGTERMVTHLDGGPMCIGRRGLRELGGFRRHAPGAGSSLVEELHARGEHAYRTHGLGLVPRGSSSDVLDPPTDPGRLP